MLDLIQRRLSCRRGIGWRLQFGDQPQDLCKQHPRHGNLGHLEDHVAPVADDPGADLDQLLTTGQRLLWSPAAYRNLLTACPLSGV
jgi:hypothetical protein